ncbi:response regulator [Argonema galeatum]|uniref:response regulator n=1 Tax=Argonema galeatum TaxID=2942762 RepID=UPI002013321F|nr:response regulator [Argonema galeatum]MCL1467937.1 response regulator [Argonema galeatum A003/A1]
MAVRETNNNLFNQQKVASQHAGRSFIRLPRSLSALETWGFGLTGHLVWIGAAPLMHAALGPAAIFVWLPATLVGVLLNIQVKRLGEQWPEMSGGTPNYTSRLLRNYPGVGRYAALGYFFSWAGFVPINAIILTNLIKANLEPLGIACPETVLKIGFTLIAYIVAFSGTRALGILHSFFIFPAVGFLLLFSLQGLGWLAFSPQSPGFFPTSWPSLTFVDWAKWYFFGIYSATACETASSFVADSRRPGQTLRFLSFAAGLIPPVYLGGSWVLMRLATEPGLGEDTFLNLLAAAHPFWGASASFLVTLLVASSCLLTCATCVSNSPRILYQLALDGQLAPVFAVVSRAGVLQPGLVLCLFISLICLIWGDISRIGVVIGSGYVASIMLVHLAVWLHRGTPDLRSRSVPLALWPWWSLCFCLLDGIALLVGSWAWGWQDLLIGLLLPLAVLAVDAAIRHISFPPFHPAWWLRGIRTQPRQLGDFVAFQVIVLIVLVCAATTIGWEIRDSMERISKSASHNLLIVLLMTVAFVAIAIACWTSLPQIAAIDEAREHAESLFITALDTVLVLDENGVIYQANPASEALLGMNPNYLVGHRLNEFLSGLSNAPENWPNRSEQTLTQRNVETDLAQSLRTIDATISNRKNLKYQEYIAILRDITDRKLSEAAVQKANAYLTAIIDNLADGLLVTDTDGTIARFNTALLPMFGIIKIDAIGQDCQTVFGSEIANLVAQTIKHPQEAFAADINLANNRSGKAVATAILKNSLRSEDNIYNCIGSVILIRDITAEKEIDRMKTDFISTVSHELRTPLTSVIGFAKLIQKKLQEAIFPLIQTEERKTQKNIRQVTENMQIIISEGERLTSLINDVLDIAKMEAGKIEWQMQPVSVLEVVERAFAATSSLFEQHGLEPIQDIQDGLPQVMGDRDRLLQVSINLISNAVKFTEKGSVTCRAIQHDNEIIISIIDTGIGIAPDDQNKVFEKFKQVGDTLTDKPKGTGLGLPISKQIVEHHGGRIWVESQLGIGSNFSFALPIVTSTSIDIEKINIDILVRQLKQSIIQTTSNTEYHHKNILVVDDDPHIRNLLRQQLEAQNYQVREAIDGLDAINQVKQEKPDLIILDVMMPQINGFDVAAVLKNDPQSMGIPIIILSIVEDKQRGYRLGIDRYLKKPINAEELLKDIDVLLSQGASKKKVLVVDENASNLKTLSEVLQAKGYSVVEASNGPECIEKALALKPDMIIVDSVFLEQHNLVKILRFEKEMENVFFVLTDGKN